jgi:hypothetical protein
MIEIPILNPISICGSQDVFSDHGLFSKERSCCVYDPQIAGTARCCSSATDQETTQPIAPEPLRPFRCGTRSINCWVRVIESEMRLWHERLPESELTSRPHVLHSQLHLRPPWDARHRLSGWHLQLRPCGYELAWRTIVRAQG